MSFWFIYLSFHYLFIFFYISFFYFIFYFIWSFCHFILFYFVLFCFIYLYLFYFFYLFVSFDLIWFSKITKHKIRQHSWSKVWLFTLLRVLLRAEKLLTVPYCSIRSESWAPWIHSLSVEGRGCCTRDLSSRITLLFTDGDEISVLIVGNKSFRMTVDFEDCIKDSPRFR